MDSATHNEQAVAAFSPEVRPVTAGGKEYKVQRLEVRQIWPILRAGIPIIEGLAARLGVDSPLGGDPKAGQPSGEPKPATALGKLLGGEIEGFLLVMADHGERVTEIVATALDEKVSVVGRWEPQELYVVAKAIVETNRDFFSHRVAPLLGQQGGGLNAVSGAVAKALRPNGDGATPSSS